MDMDMDVAWCLTCSKRTPDPRKTYCSEACRKADCLPSASSSSVPLSSPVPAALYSSPKLGSLDRRRSSVSPVKKSVPRPAITPLVSIPTVSEAAFVPVKVPAPRDRRAFSFPAQTSPPIPISERSQRASIVLPPFTRRPIVSGLTPLSPPLRPVTESRDLRGKLVKGRITRSTGGINTPVGAPESVFLSTSESSDGGDDHVSHPALIPSPTIHLSPPQASTVPSAEFSTLRSKLSTVRSNSLRTRDTHSPVAALVASSASSRSREDIISWAKAINHRNQDDDDDEDHAAEMSEEGKEESRGRSRTRRISDFEISSRLGARKSIDEEDEVKSGDGASTGPGTTPKGRIGSALAGLSMSGYGVGTLVKALTSVTTTPVRPPTLATARQSPAIPQSSSSMLGLAAVPAPAEVSKVDVIASTLPIDDHNQMPYLIGGGTPTLSTISFSEVVDPSVIGTHDHVDIVTDDGAGYSGASSSGFIRRSSLINAKIGRKGSVISTGGKVQPVTAVVMPPLPERQERIQMRPIASTATAIWNLSNYLSKFAPFSISSVIAPYAPFAAATSSTKLPTDSSRSQLPSATTTATGTVTSSALTTKPNSPESIPNDVDPLTPTPGPVSALITSKANSPPESPEQQLVRSLPMDIVLSPQLPSVDPYNERRPSLWDQNYAQRVGTGETHENRSRVRSSRSRARSRSRRRSRSRSPSAGRLFDDVFTTKTTGVGGSKGLELHDDGDADVSEGESERGRGRGKSRVLHLDVAQGGGESTEVERGRSRGRTGRSTRA